MCLILLAHRVHPEYPLVFAANRDEFYARATSPAAWWPDAPQVLAGRDLVAGGTWMGVTRSGRWAAVTNYRDLRTEPAEPVGRLSRGELVSGFLRDGATVADYMDQVVARAGQFAGFNLLVGDGEHLGYVSNRGAASRMLGPGLYGLSNHLLDSPWPKVERGKIGLHSRIAAGTPLSPERLFEILFDAEPAPDAALPDTGVGPELERALSSSFIATPTYGTRSSTVLLVRRTGAAVFVERSYFPQRGDWDEIRFDFDLAPVSGESG
jgi:uncharacterized protein with NRDE domain